MVGAPRGLAEAFGDLLDGQAGPFKADLEGRLGGLNGVG